MEASERTRLPTSARDLSPAEWQERVDASFAVEARVKEAISVGREALWALAEALYDFDEMGGWYPLGHRTKNEWLAQPEIGMSRTWMHRMVRTWRTLVVNQGVTVATLRDLDASKVAIVLRAIEAHEVECAEALDDVEALGARDLRIKYGMEDEIDPVQAAGGPQDATREVDAMDVLDDDDEPQIGSERVLELAWEQVDSAIASQAPKPRLRRVTLIALRNYYRPEADGDGRAR